MVDSSQHSADVLNRRLDSDLLTSNRPRRINLPNLPILVNPLLLLTIQIQLHASLRPKPPSFLLATPSLVNLHLPARSVERESRSIAGVLARDLTVVDLVAVEEVVELGGCGAADGFVGEGGVGEGEVYVAPGVLVGGGGEDVGGVVVEVLEGPGGDLLAGGHAGCGWLLVSGWVGEGEGCACQEEGGQEGDHFVCGRCVDGKSEDEM